MKQNKFFILAAALAFVACSSDDSFTSEKQQAPSQQQEVAFDSYVNRGITRAGQTGVEDLDAVKTSGFGVFGYYTNAESYDNLTYTPNFMYNQEVSWSTDKWTYTPIKYWPNEYGIGSQSDDVDKVSFFAYAPYVTVDAKSGKLAADDDWGIVSMTRNNEAGDPMVKYISTLYTDQQVDLLWGTVPTGTTSWEVKNSGANQIVKPGLPWLDMQHPYNTATAQKVSFDFKHATAQLNVTVDTKTDGTTPANPNANTKVFIRSVTFEGFDTKGALNLNNTTKDIPLWYNFNCGSELNNGKEITIQDGRKDGKEGLTAATKEYAAINPTFVQSSKFDASPVGVTGTTENLFCKSDGTITNLSTDPIFVIPNGDKLKVTIDYDVLTKDGNLAGTLNDGETNGSVVKNVITRYITTDGKGSTTAGNITLENGKKYTISLHLGLNSVQFDAAVTAWGTETGGADLPHNN